MLVWVSDIRFSLFTTIWVLKLLVLSLIWGKTVLNITNFSLVKDLIELVLKQTSGTVFTADENDKLRCENCAQTHVEEWSLFSQLVALVRMTSQFRFRVPCLSSAVTVISNLVNSNLVKLVNSNLVNLVNSNPVNMENSKAIIGKF